MPKWYEADDLPDGAAILMCSMCGERLHWYLPGSDYDADALVEESGQAVLAHLREHHPVRFGLSRLLRWPRLINRLLG